MAKISSAHHTNSLNFFAPTRLYSYLNVEKVNTDQYMTAGVFSVLFSSNLKVNRRK